MESSGYSIGFKCRCSRTLYVRVESEPFSEAALEPCPSTVVKPLLHSLTFEDVGRLLQREGYTIRREERSITGGPGWRTVGRPGFDAVPYFEAAPGSPRFRALWLTASFRFGFEEANAVLQHVAPMHALGHITREDDGTLTVVQAILVAGGVTEAHLQLQLGSWRNVLQCVADCARERPEAAHDD